MDFVDPRDKFWSLYLEHAEEEVKVDVERWRGDMNGVLIFVCLFAATVSTFVIESYKKLSVDPQDQTVALLRQIAAGINGTALPGPNGSVENFTVPASTFYVNVCWFGSLTLSITGALCATLVQQW
ncbi:hypothetical protein K488DRAFT_53340, partial [Vararia minispora EC-137]